MSVSKMKLLVSIQLALLPIGLALPSVASAHGGGGGGGFRSGGGFSQGRSAFRASQAPVGFGNRASSRMSGYRGPNGQANGLVIPQSNAGITSARLPYTPGSTFMPSAPVNLPSSGNGGNGSGSSIPHLNPNLPHFPFPTASGSGVTSSGSGIPHLNPNLPHFPFPTASGSGVTSSGSGIPHLNPNLPHFPFPTASGSGANGSGSGIPHLNPNLPHFPFPTASGSGATSSGSGIPHLNPNLPHFPFPTASGSGANGSGSAGSGNGGSGGNSGGSGGSGSSGGGSGGGSGGSGGSSGGSGGGSGGSGGSGGGPFGGFGGFGGGYGGGGYGGGGYAGDGSSGAGYATPATYVDSNPTNDLPATAVVPAATTNVDLVLEDVVLVHPATVAAGPAYRVQFRNQGADDAGRFSVGILAMIDGLSTSDAPRSMVEMRGLAAGDVASVILRLPQSATRLVSNQQTTPTMFTKLAVAVDVNQQQVETDKTNNGAIIDRASLEGAAEYAAIRKD